MYKYCQIQYHSLFDSGLPHQKYSVKLFSFLFFGKNIVNTVYWFCESVERKVNSANHTNQWGEKRMLVCSMETTSLARTIFAANNKSVAYSQSNNAGENTSKSIELNSNCSSSIPWEKVKAIEQFTTFRVYLCATLCYMAYFYAQAQVCAIVWLLVFTCA